MVWQTDVMHIVTSLVMFILAYATIHFEQDKTLQVPLILTHVPPHFRQEHVVNVSFFPERMQIWQTFRNILRLPVCLVFPHCLLNVQPGTTWHVSWQICWCTFWRFLCFDVFCFLADMIVSQVLSLITRWSSVFTSRSTCHFATSIFVTNVSYPTYGYRRTWYLNKNHGVYLTNNFAYFILTGRCFHLFYFS